MIVKERIIKWIVYILLWLCTFLVVYPLFFMFKSSLKTHGEIMRTPFGLPDFPRFQNYIDAWTKTSLGVNFFNSMIVTIGSLALLIFVVTLAGYALARFPFPGHKSFFLLMIILVAIPVHSLLVPVYYFMEQMHFSNSLFGIILVYATFGLPFSIIIMRAFFEAVPVAIEEAAKIDGCNSLRVFWNVAVPMAKPGIATVAIINVIGIWSEYLFASVLLTRPEVRTLPVAIASLSSGEAGFDLGILFSGLSIATIPMLIIYFIFSQQIVKGVSSGGVK